MHHRSQKNEKDCLWSQMDHKGAYSNGSCFFTSRVKLCTCCQFCSYSRPILGLLLDLVLAGSGVARVGESTSSTSIVLPAFSPSSCAWGGPWWTTPVSWSRYPISRPVVTVSFTSLKNSLHACGWQACLIICYRSAKLICSAKQGQEKLIPCWKVSKRPKIPDSLLT